MISGPDVPEERRVDISKTPRDLSLQDIAHIVQAFKDWPFAPTVSLQMVRFFPATGSHFVLGPERR